MPLQDLARASSVFIQVGVSKEQNNISQGVFRVFSRQKTTNLIVIIKKDFKYNVIDYRIRYFALHFLLCLNKIQTIAMSTLNKP